jgi:hypothetical protein
LAPIKVAPFPLAAAKKPEGAETKTEGILPSSLPPFLGILLSFLDTLHPFLLSFLMTRIPFYQGHDRDMHSTVARVSLEAADPVFNPESSCDPVLSDGNDGEDATANDGEDAQQQRRRTRAVPAYHPLLLKHAASNLFNAKNMTKKVSLRVLANHIKSKDPWIAGLNPLYKDYHAHFWWFEILKFCTTLFFCGPVTTLPSEGATQVFFSMIVSVGMMLIFANCAPYLGCIP